MTTQVQMKHLGGNHRIEVVNAETGDVIRTLEKAEDFQVEFVYPGRSILLRETTDEQDIEPGSQKHNIGGGDAGSAVEDVRVLDGGNAAGDGDSGAQDGGTP